MPKIPGVNDGSFIPPPRARVRPTISNGKSFALIAGISAAALVIVIAAMWWIVSARRASFTLHTMKDGDDPSSWPTPAFHEQTVTGPAKDGPTIAATVEELSKPWSAKKFNFVKPITHEHVDAIVIRLPDGVLWAFALQEPYGRCTLDFVTDLNVLANDFDFRAGHPMVVNPCNHTIYDPLKIGAAGGDVWVRGEIVHGIGLRPPISIEVQAKGRAIIATRME